MTQLRPLDVCFMLSRSVVFQVYGEGLAAAGRWPDVVTVAGVDVRVVLMCILES